MTKRPQLNLTPPASLLDRLESLAKTFKGDPTRKNEIALEVLKDYLPLWEVAAAAHVEFVNRQRLETALKALEGSEVAVIAKHEDTNAPTARAVGQTSEDEVELVATDEQDERAVNDEHQKKAARKRCEKRRWSVKVNLDVTRP